MTEPSPYSRRQLLRISLWGAASWLASARLLEAGEPTPPQTRGPFHPLRRRPDGETIDRRLLEHLDRDSDLTTVEGRDGEARGRRIYATGRTRSEEDAPLEGAEVEIWQACSSGRYNHRSDPSEEWLDPSFQYWGRARTDAEGRFLFRTVLPGAYLAAPGWVRPPHIHCTIRKPGFRALTTQLYFRGVPYVYEGETHSPERLARLNERDHILDRVPARLREQVVADARRPRPEEDLEEDSEVFAYELVLRAGSGPERGGGRGGAPAYGR